MKETYAQEKKEIIKNWQTKVLDQERIIKEKDAEIENLNGQLAFSTLANLIVVISGLLIIIF